MTLAPAVRSPSTDWTTLLCLLATGALLGLSAILAKLSSQAGLPALPFLLWSVSGAAIILTVRNVLRGLQPTLNARTAEYFLIAALVSFAAPNLILFAAIPHVGAGFAALGLAFPPLYTYLGALALRQERFVIHRATGVLFALAGAATLAFHKFAEPDAPAGWIAAALFAPVLLAMGNLYRTLRWPPGTTPDELAPGMLTASAIMLAAFGLASGADLSIPMDRMTPAVLVVLQAAAFSIQYVLFFLLQKRGGPVLLSLLGSVAAVVAVPIAVLLLEETWPQGLLVATALIAAGIGLVAVKPKSAAAP